MVNGRRHYGGLAPVPRSRPTLHAGQRPGGPIRGAVVSLGATRTPGALVLPPGADASGPNLGAPVGVVIVVPDGAGRGRGGRHQMVAGLLADAGLAVLLVDLLALVERGTRSDAAEVAVLAERLVGATHWVATQPGLAGLRVGYLGVGLGSAAALVAAATVGSGEVGPHAAKSAARVGAVVCRGGRPELAGDHLSRVTVPTLLLAGGRDRARVERHSDVASRLGGRSELAVIAGAGSLFAEPGALTATAQRSAHWFGLHLRAAAPPAAEGSG
jgi:putative phosphoribosyl transferase